MRRPRLVVGTDFASMEGLGHVTKYIELIRRFALGLAAMVVAVLLAPTMAFAQVQENLPQDWQVYFDEPASPIMRDIVSFNNAIMVIITIITIFVVGLLAWVMIRYRAKTNPVPTKTTHNTVIEVLWTIVPVIILVGITIPSFSLLFAQYDPGRVVDDYNPDDAINVKITGWTWSWQYEFPDLGVSPYISNPILETSVEPDATIFGGAPDRVFGGEPRLLETDLPLVVPVDRVIRLQVTAPPTGVLHAFALPAMGVKLDAVPGRLGESWFLAEREGTFFGQCSELCGRYHYAMPIELRVVSGEQFDEWVAVVSSSGPAAGKELLDTWEAERLAEQVAAR